MRALSLLLLLGAFPFALTSRDSTFKRVAIISATDAGNNCVSVGNGAMLKVSCFATDGGGQDTYVGSGAADGGASCLMSDGGIQCDMIRFSLGEKFFSQLPGPNIILNGQAQVCVLQPQLASTCRVFQGQ
jgi:hypothetical protein